MNRTSLRADGRSQGLGLAAFAVGVSAFASWMFLQRRWWLPEPASLHGADLDREFLVTLGITGFMFIAVHLALGFLIFRFGRGRPSSRRAPGRVFEFRFALVAASVVLLVDISLFFTGETALRRAFGDRLDAVVVEATGEQFLWNFRYPGPDGEFGRTDPFLVHATNNPLGLDLTDPASHDDIVRINQLHLPLGRPAVVRLRAKDVIHSFALPNLRVRQDAVPGMTIDVSFRPTETGTFEIMCAQLCGLGHYRMRAFLTVESPEDFEHWLDGED